MGQPILDVADLITEFSIMQSKGVGKFHSKQFGCKKLLDLLTVDVLNGFYCIWIQILLMLFDVWLILAFSIYG